MLIRNILCLIILAISPYQAHGMKRVGDESLDSTITTKKACFELSGNQAMFDDIKKSINSFDPIALNSLTSTEHASLLSNEQKNNLHSTAKELKQNIMQMQQMGSIIAAQTDNEDVKAKFSYDTERKNLQKISRNLSAFKTLPSLVFPQAIFTPVPLCDYKQLQSDQRIKPDQCLAALIKNEQTAIRLCCFHITLENIAKELIKKVKQGVAVEVITDQKQGEKETDNHVIKTLSENGISVLSPQKQYEQMHHKFCIFDCNIGDKSLLWTGSYNLTAHGNSHSWDDANILDHKTMIKQYSDRFEEVKNRTNTFSIPTQQQPQLTKTQLIQPQQPANTSSPLKPLTNNNHNNNNNTQQRELKNPVLLLQKNTTSPK